jgi:hypothetical protein
MRCSSHFRRSSHDRDETSIITGIPLNQNTQFMNAVRAHLAGYNLTEGDGSFVRSLQSIRMNQAIEVANVRMGSDSEYLAARMTNPLTRSAQ